MRNICVIVQSFEQHAFRMRIIHVWSCYCFDDYGTAGAALEHDWETAGAVLVS